MATSTDQDPTSYGIEAGYSQDYGSNNRPKLYPTHDNTEYSASEVVDTQRMTQPQSTAPVNPFAHEEYEEKVTNPFAKKNQILCLTIFISTFSNRS